MWQKGRRSTHTTDRRTSKATQAPQSARARLAPSKVAQQRRRVQALKASAVLVTIVSFIGALSWLSFLDVLAVQHVAVEGNTDVRTRELQAYVLQHTASAYLGLFSQQTTVLYPQDTLEQKIAYAFPKLESVTVDAQPTQKQAVVTVREREVYGLWCRQYQIGPDCYAIDSNGFIFENRTLSGGDAAHIVFYSGLTESVLNPIRSRVAPDYFADVRTFIERLNEADLSVQSVTFSDNNKDATLVIDGEWELLVALDEDLNVTALNLQAVLDEYQLRDRLSEVAYVDMRFGERVYYTYKGTDEAEEVSE